MSEPEDIILDGAYRATLAVRRLWLRNSQSSSENALRLVEVKGRLDFFVNAVFGSTLRIVPAEPPAAPNLFSRLGRRIPRHLVERRTLSSTDGVRLRLPPDLSSNTSPISAMEKYQLLASEASVRAIRGTCAFLPEEPLVRDLFLIREAGAIDRFLASILPGLRNGLNELKTAALKNRPALRLLTPIEAAVESEIEKTLRMPILELAPTENCETSLKWAEESASRFRSLEGRYRGLPSVELWGRVDAFPDVSSHVSTSSGTQDAPVGPTRIGRMKRRPNVRKAEAGEDDPNVGIWMIQADDPQEHVEDPMGLQRPTDREEEADAGELADSLSELPEARLVTSPGSPREFLASDDPPPAGISESFRRNGSTRFTYPEWDYRCCGYRESATSIRELEPSLGSPEWAASVLRRRAAMLHEVRRRFERLRPKHRRFGRQTDGPEIDLSVYVETHADRKAGCPADDRLYLAIRPARRDIAISLLVDVSGSTDGWVTEDLRVIDVEKEALLVVCAALDALGDPYSILAFSGEGPESVTLLPLKRFEDTSGALVHRRIAALEPERFTRMGAAIRHATASLMNRPAEHRLLLLLSDGKPNDMDLYEGRYGIEDSRQAVAEARLQRIHPFCVTVDRHAPSYMPRIFGTRGYAALHRSEHLPSVLVEVLRRLVKE